MKAATLFLIIVAITVANVEGEESKKEERVTKRNMIAWRGFLDEGGCSDCTVSAVGVLRCNCWNSGNHNRAYCTLNLNDGILSLFISISFLHHLCICHIFFFIFFSSSNFLKCRNCIRFSNMITIQPILCQQFQQFMFKDCHFY